MNIIKAVRSAFVTRECKRLMPAASHKTEPVVQRRNPARAAKKAQQQAARRAA